MKAQGESHFITIPANGTLGPMRWPGTNFRVLDSTDDFLVAFDGSAFLPASIGLPYSAPTLDEFRVIAFKNPTATDITATVYAGNLDTRDERKVYTGSVAAIIIPTAAVPTQFLKTSTAAAAPVALKAVSTSFSKATLLAKNSLAGADNTGNVNIGPSPTANQQPFLLAPGDELVLAPAIGLKWDFADWYLKVATNGDGVVVIYS